MTRYMGQFITEHQKHFCLTLSNSAYLKKINLHFNFSMTDLHCMYFVTLCICVAQFSRGDIVGAFDVLQRRPGDKAKPVTTSLTFGACV